LAIIGLVLSGLGLLATIINAIAGAAIGLQNPEMFNSILNR
jgi:hypothetical protein